MAKENTICIWWHRSRKIVGSSVIITQYSGDVFAVRVFYVFSVFYYQKCQSISKSYCQVVMVCFIYLSQTIQENSVTRELQTQNLAKKKASESVPICDVNEIYEVLMMSISEQLGNDDSTVSSFISYKTDLNNRGNHFINKSFCHGLLNKHWRVYFLMRSSCLIKIKSSQLF